MKTLADVFADKIESCLRDSGIDAKVSGGDIGIGKEFAEVTAKVDEPLSEDEAKAVCQMTSAALGGATVIHQVENETDLFTARLV